MRPDLAPLRARVGRLGERSPAYPALTLLTGQALLLFLIELVANVIDYLFHAFAGRSLLPSDFATLQTMNSAFLIVGTAFAVVQPVTARYTAQASEPDERETVLTVFTRQGLVLGLFLTAAVWLGRSTIATWLNLPVAAVAIATTAVLPFLVRPVMSGFLQGEQRFAPLGLTHLLNAGARLVLLALLVNQLGSGLVAAVAPLAGALILSLALGVVYARPDPLRLLGSRLTARERTLLNDGFRLSVAAFLIYGAYMSLLNLDVIIANRTMTPEVAAGYAAAVVLRRVLSLLPGTIIIILFPHVAGLVARGQSPDRLIARAMALVIGGGLAITALYLLFGPWLLNMAYGGRYVDFGAILGVLALGMVGYGIVAVWLNVFLASRPWPFASLMVGLALIQAIGLGLSNGQVTATAWVFAVSGWLAAAGGTGLYFAWLRPRHLQLVSSHSKPT